LVVFGVVILIVGIVAVL